MCLCCVFTDIANYHLLRQRFHLMLWLYLQQLLWELIQSVQEQMMPKYLMALSHFLASQGLWGKRCICRRLGQWLDGTCWSIGVFCSFFKIYSSWWWWSSRIERGKINVPPLDKSKFLFFCGECVLVLIQGCQDVAFPSKIYWQVQYPLTWWWVQTLPSWLLLSVLSNLQVHFVLSSGVIGLWAKLCQILEYYNVLKC